MENDDKNRYQTKLDKAIEQSERHTRMLKNKVPNALGKFADSHCNSDWKLSKNGRVKVNWISASKDAPQPKPQPIKLSDSDKSALSIGRFIQSKCDPIRKYDKDNPKVTTGIYLFSHSKKPLDISNSDNNN